MDYFSPRHPLDITTENFIFVCAKKPGKAVEKINSVTVKVRLAEKSIYHVNFSTKTFF